VNPEGESLLERARELTLVNTGRKSGLARETELWFAYLAGEVYLLAGADSMGTPTQWYRNLQVNPTAMLKVKGKSIPAVSQPVGDAQALDSHIRGLFEAKYGRSIMRRWYGGGRHLPVKLKVVA